MLDSTETRGYNGLGQLISVSGIDTPATYSYRPDGLRHSKVVGGVTHIHLWDGQNIVAEVGATGVVNTRYLRGVNLVAREIDGALQYYQFDAHGDVLHRIDASGNVLKTYVYDAFGVETDPEPLDTNPFRYCGEYFDRETGTYYLRARNYDPRTGRFITEDAVRGTSYEVPNSQKITDSLSLNLYTYCKNNPVMYIDPRGKASKELQAFLDSQSKGGKKDPWQAESEVARFLGKPEKNWDFDSLSEEAAIARLLFHEDPSMKGQYGIVWTIKNRMDQTGWSAKKVIQEGYMVEGASWVYNVEGYFNPYKTLEESTIWDEQWLDAAGQPTYFSWLNAVGLARALTDGYLGDNPFEGKAKDPTKVIMYFGSKEGNNTFNIHMGNSWFAGN